MDDAVAYADNWSDRSLLEQVGRAVVVHPHGRLLRLARVRGWDIVRPRRPARSRPTAGSISSRRRKHDS
jgi:phosphoserine phosphatase